MDLIQQINNYLQTNKLPVEYKIVEKCIFINCKGWDIVEIDDMIIDMGGSREGFIIKIDMEKI